MSIVAEKDNEEQTKLEDILRSIKEIIHSKNDSSDEERDSEEAILELTENDVIMSSDSFNKTASIIRDYTKKLETHSYKDESIDSIMIDLIKPLLKDWIDDNMPKLVERILREEIKKLVPKNGVSS